MTQLHQALLDYIHAYFEARNEGPPTSDVVKHFRSRHKGGVSRALEKMAVAGYLVPKNGRWVLKAPWVQLHLLPFESTGPRPR